MQPTYQEIPSYSDVPSTQTQWTTEFAKDEYYLNIVTHNDKIYGFYKWDRKTNYKEGVANSLGVMEHTQVFRVMH